MSKLVCALVLGAMLVAVNLAGATAGAQEQTSTGDAVERFRAGERASQEQPMVATSAEATSPMRPAEPGGGPGSLAVALGLSAAALVGALAAMTARRTSRRLRARQAA